MEKIMYFESKKIIWGWTCSDCNKYNEEDLEPDRWGVVVCEHCSSVFKPTKMKFT